MLQHSYSGVYICLAEVLVCILVVQSSLCSGDRSGLSIMYHVPKAQEGRVSFYFNVPLCPTVFLPQLLASYSGFWSLFLSLFLSLLHFCCSFFAFFVALALLALFLRQSDKKSAKKKRRSSTYRGRGGLVSRHSVPSPESYRSEDQRKEVSEEQITRRK